MKQFYLKFYTLLLCLVIGGGNVWAYTLPTATMDLKTVSEETIGNWADKTSYELSDDYLVVSGYASYKSVSNQNWITHSSVGNSASTWETVEGYPFKGSSYYTTGSYATIQSGRYLVYRVTNCKSVSIYGKNNSTTKYLSVKIYEVSEGVAKTTAAFTLEDKSISTEMILAQELNATKEYAIDIEAVGNSNSRVFEVAFERNVDAGDVENTPVESVSLSSSTASIYVGEKTTIEETISPANATNKNVTWSSSKEEVAIVSNGVVTGISEGTATITVTTEDGNKTASCEVTVKPADIYKVKYTYNFNDKKSYPEGFPTAGKTANKQEFVISGYPIVINASSYYIINSTTANCGLFFGKTSTSNSKPLEGTAYLGFPAKEGYKLAKVVATLTNGCAGGLPVNVYESDSWTAKSTSVNTVNGEKAVLEFEINEPEENTAYRLTAGGTSGKNLQFDNIVLTYTKVVTLSLAAKLGSDNYATFSFDRAVEFENDVVYTVSASGETLSINPVASKQVPANTGVLIKSVNAEEKYSVINSAEALEGNMLQPASKDMSEVSGCQFYKLAYDNYTDKTELGFYWGAANGGTFTCKAGTAYLAVPASAGVKSFVFAGDATAIKSVAVPTVDANAPVYNMAGQRVSANTKGIVFQNGKKYFNK